MRATVSAAEPPAIYEDQLTTEADVLKKGYGDVEAAFRNAHAVVSLELSIGRHSGVPLETRGAIARYDETYDILELHGAAKVPHWNRDTIAQMLQRKKESVQLFEGHVGGGFGVRGELYPEDILVCAAALKFRRPIKWIEDRREHLIATNHSREQIHRVRAAIDAQGRILCIDDEFFHDNGAYMRTHAATVPDLAAAMLPGPYRVPVYPRDRSHSADQQDTVRHLPRAGPLRVDLRTGATVGRNRRQGRRGRRRDSQT
jgi:CO/xanthine dehydrogenase Mo-binding subunit